MSTFFLSTKFKKYLWASLLVTLILRLLTMTILPLTDTTEARYAELARKMLETGNWVTPQHAYGVPFWAKPPLSIWSSALSMEVFGVNEFAARLPSLLYSLGILYITWFLAKARRNKDFALLNAVILFALPLFFISAGAVMTDACLAFCVCLSLLSYWFHADTENNLTVTKKTFYGYLFFMGIGLGTLAKGPMCLALIVPPIVLWQLTHRDLRNLKQLPWITGILLTIVIATPWYVLAEQRTPGFINYFIIGEHFKRFLVPGWSGDLYGHAHQVPLGMIWFYMAVATFPWVLIILYWTVKNINHVKRLCTSCAYDKWVTYLFYWTIWPLIFFTVAKNIIIPYTLTTFMPFVLLITELWEKNKTYIINPKKAKDERWIFLALGLPVVSVCTGVLLVTYYPSISMMRTQKQLAQKYMMLRESKESQLYFYLNQSYSSEFYSLGAAKNTNDFDKIKNLLKNNTRDFIVIKTKKEKNLVSISKSITKVGVFGDYILYMESK